MVNTQNINDIKAKIKSNKLISKASFYNKTLMLEEELERNFVRMTQRILLIEDVFTSQGITAIVEHLHDNARKRLPRALFTTIIDGISVLTGLFSAPRIFEYSSSVLKLRY